MRGRGSRTDSHEIFAGLRSTTPDLQSPGPHTRGYPTSCGSGSSAEPRSTRRIPGAFLPMTGTVLPLSEAYFQKAEERFRSLVKRPLESDVSSEVLRYFQIRKKWDNHEYVVPVTEDLELLNVARQRFHGNQFETLYHAWRSGELSKQELRVEFLRLRPARTVFFDKYLVRSHQSPFDFEGKSSGRCVKDTDHHPVHRSVHPVG